MSWFYSKAKKGKVDFVFLEKDKYNPKLYYHAYDLDSKGVPIEVGLLSVLNPSDKKAIDMYHKQQKINNYIQYQQRRINY